MELDKAMKAIIIQEASRDISELGQQAMKYQTWQLSDTEQYNLLQNMIYISRKIVFSLKLMSGHTPEY